MCWFRFYLGVPEERPGQLHLYVVSSAVPRAGAPLITPQCLSCSGVVPVILPSHYENAATDSSGTRETYDWDEQPETQTTTEEPQPKRRKKKGQLVH